MYNCVPEYRRLDLEDVDPGLDLGLVDVDLDLGCVLFGSQYLHELFQFWAVELENIFLIKKSVFFYVFGKRQ